MGGEKMGMRVKWYEEEVIEVWGGKMVERVRGGGGRVVGGVRVGREKNV